MCKYCEFDESGLNDCDFPSYDNETNEVLNLYKDNENAFICIEQSKTEPWFKINYCPMCGRKLSD